MEVYCGKYKTNQRIKEQPLLTALVIILSYDIFRRYGWQVGELNGFDNLCPRCSGD